MEYIEIIIPSLVDKIEEHANSHKALSQLLEDIWDRATQNPRNYESSELLTQICRLEDTIDSIIATKVLQRQNISIKKAPVKYFSIAKSIVKFPHKLHRQTKELKKILNDSLSAPIPEEKLPSKSDAVEVPAKKSSSNTVPQKKSSGDAAVLSKKPRGIQVSSENKDVGRDKKDSDERHRQKSEERNILSDILKQVPSIKQEASELSNQLLRKRLHDFLVFKSRVLLICEGITSTNGSKEWSSQQLGKSEDYLLEQSRILGMKDIMTELYQSILSDNKLEEKNRDLVTLETKLCNLLAPKRYLIVLYDVWTADVWDKLKEAFPNPMNGSRMILTVSEADVAWQTNSSSVFGTANESEFVGLDDKVQELAELLLESYQFLISVVGVAGSGKTMLVKAIFSNLLMQLGMVRKDESWSTEELRKRLGLFLAWKRYLIVLDDVYTADAWEKLKYAFPNSSNGSRVILTTRDACVPRNIKAHTRVIQLRLLNDDESWELFVEKVPTVVEKPELMKALKENILRRCGGLPLDIVVLGGLLSTKELEIPVWSKFIKQLEEKDGKGQIEEIGPSEAPAMQEEEKVKHGATKEDQEPSPNQSPSSSDTTQKEDNRILETQNTSLDLDQSGSSDETLSFLLALGYKDLNAHLKFCLNYLGLFPKPYKVPFRRLFHLLQAEGLLKQETTEESFEEQVKKYIEDLKKRNMIEVEKKLNGSPKTICMTSTVYDELSPRAERAGLFHIHFNHYEEYAPKQFGYIRRLAEHQEISYDRLLENSYQLRSYISFRPEIGDLPAFGVDKLLKGIVKGGFGLIFILDLEGVYQPVLSKHLGKFPKLKYLGLRWTFLDSIPDSVGDLLSLETLDVKHTNIITLPGEFWKAKCLQHLYMSDICIDTSIPTARQTNGSLTNLKTLLGLVIHNEKTVDYLKEANGLRKLEVTCYGESIVEIVGWISMLTQLQSLKLRPMSRNLFVGGAEQEQPSGTDDDERTPTGYSTQPEQFQIPTGTRHRHPRDAQPVAVVTTHNFPALSNIVVSTKPKGSGRLNNEPSSSKHSEELMRKNANLERQLQEVQKSIDELKSPRSHQQTLDLDSAPLNLSITAEPYQEGFKIPHLQTYDGSGDPNEYLYTYQAIMRIQNANDAMMCKVHQKEGESLRDYMQRFNKATLDIDNVPDTICLSALLHGLKHGRRPNDELMIDKAKAKNNHSEERKKKQKVNEQWGKPSDFPKYDNYIPLTSPRGMIDLKGRGISLAAHRTCIRITNILLSRAEHTGAVNLIRTINMILSGIHSRGQSARGRKAYAHQVMTVNKNRPLKRPFKEAKWENAPITFSAADYKRADGEQDVMMPHADPFVATVHIGNHNVNKVFIDTGSSPDILYWSYFQKMQLNPSSLQKYEGPMYGFDNQPVPVEGVITLPIYVGSEPRFRMAFVSFLVVKIESAFNAILGRATLCELKAVFSQPHLCMKFPTPQGVGVLKGNQKMVRACYQGIFKKVELAAASAGSSEIHRPAQLDQQTMSISDIEHRPESVEQKAEPVEPVEMIPLNLDTPERTVKVGTKLTAGERAELLEFLRVNQDVFAWTTDEMPGIPAELVVHKLSTDPIRRPVVEKRHLFGPEKQAAIDEEIQKLLQACFIRRVEYSERVSNSVLVKKPNGKWRMCIDFTNLNETCPKNPHPLPNVEKLVELAAGHEQMSFLDASSGYHQVIFKLQIGRNIEVYVDDMTVTSKRAEDHIDDLDETFQNLRRAQMKLNPLKCTFAVESGKFLGYVISKKGIEVNPEKVQAVQQMESPKTIKDVQRLIGCVVVLHRFIARSAERCLPFFKALTPAVQACGGGEIIPVFGGYKGGGQAVADFLVECLSVTVEERALVYSVWVLYVDGAANIEGSGARAVLVGLDGFKSEHALRFKFQTTNNVAEYEALIYGLKLASELQVQSIKIFSDSQLVVGQVNGSCEIKDSQLGRYASGVNRLKLGFAFFHIDKILRADNQRADELSKLASSQDINPQRSTIVEVLDAPSYTDFTIECQLLSTDPSSPSWTTSLIQYMRSGELPEDPSTAKLIKRRAAHFTLLDNQLYKRAASIPLLRCLTPYEAEYAVREIHEGICGTHIGGKTLARKLLRHGYYWPTMVEDTQNYVKKCPTYQFHADDIHMLVDLLSPFVKGKGGCTYLVVVSNGQAESANKIVLRGLKTRVLAAYSNWVDELNKVFWSCCTTPSSATGENLFSLAYGVEAVIPVEVGLPSDRSDRHDDLNNEQLLRENLDLVEEVREMS
ncbi:hypothetical protein SLEP1_g25700 [Rubroshorea leprosula]|uniref:RNase H type-1 domain-containing protein n=1 Tax=Rubroshorea leprosula TaxID=152421 RepID=A0AAV5JTM6_9ROSI|nr:hypothetical protein SLEP1_g25700 [Rubroshorea leprosula]